MAPGCVASAIGAKCVVVFAIVANYGKPSRTACLGSASWGSSVSSIIDAPDWATPPGRHTPHRPPIVMAQSTRIVVRAHTANVATSLTLRKRYIQCYVILVGHYDVNDGTDDGGVSGAGGVGSLLLYLDYVGEERRGAIIEGGEFLLHDLGIVFETYHGFAIWMYSSMILHQTLRGYARRGERMCSAHFLNQNLTARANNSNRAVCERAVKRQCVRVKV